MTFNTSQSLDQIPKQRAPPTGQMNLMPFSGKASNEIINRMGRSGYSALACGEEYFHGIKKAAFH